MLKPPINYIIIAVVIGIMVLKQFSKKKKETSMLKKLQDSEDEPNPFDGVSDINEIEKDSEEVNSGTFEEVSDINEIEKDSEYSEHVKKSDIITDDDKAENTKTDESKKEE